MKLNLLLITYLWPSLLMKCREDPYKYSTSYFTLFEEKTLIP